MAAWNESKASIRLILGAFALIAAFVASPAQAIERKLLIGTFDNLVVDGDMQVIVQTGKSPSAKASGDRRVLDSLKMDRSGLTLRIRVNEIINNDKKKPITEPLIITLTTRQIKDVALRGNAKLDISQIQQPGRSSLAISGGGEINVGSVQVDQLVITMLGNGKMNLAGGSARESSVKIDGAAIYQAAAVQSRNFKIEQNGNATSSANVSEKAEISNNGSGNITIGGRGECFIRKAGSARINCSKFTDKAN